MARTKWRSDFWVENRAYKSKVKMVAILLIIEARDETIAANRAAKTKPFRPTGSNVNAKG